MHGKEVPQSASKLQVQLVAYNTSKDFADYLTLQYHTLQCTELISTLFFYAPS